MKKIINCLLFLAFVLSVHAQTGVEVYPTHWWVGMKHKNIQLMLHQKDVAKLDVQMKPYAGVNWQNIIRVENPNYLFISISIDDSAKPGMIDFYTTDTKSKKQKTLLSYELKARRDGNGTAYAQGVHSSDFIYFLMPDRFSNGDVSNDHVAGMKDQSLNRDSIFLRHGGDMQGIINHLDYLQSLGATALWMTPVLENDMPDRTEHGYAFTNHYKIEPRLGGENAYHKLSDELHKRGMKLIQDAVYNHVGLYNFIVQDMPDKTWLHQWPTFTQPNYKEQVFFDPYASQKDKKQMADGWFTNQMPDLNQGNPFVADFLIQHAIWCVEEFGVDAWRIDTYKYVDLEFMNRCNQALTDEYPNITMFGETWGEGVVNQAYLTKNNINTDFKSNLTGALDFEALFGGIQPALTQMPWGVNRLYQTVSLDFLYQQPMNNVIFLDNHDMTRFFSQVGEDVNKQKMGIEWLLTMRGIPQMYYGTEIIMKGVSNPDGWVRLDFPGGWDGDKKNAFTGEGLTSDESSVQSLVKKLANFRKTSSALTNGKMMQYVPVNGLYVYFRYDDKQTIMCVMNTNENAQNISFENYAERTRGFTKATDIISGTSYNTSFSVPAKQMLVLELK